MEQIVIKNVSDKTYNKRRKNFAKGVKVKSKVLSDSLKNNLLNAAFAVLFYIIIGLICTLIVNTKSLWYETLVKPSYILARAVYIPVNITIIIMLMFVFYKAATKKDKVQIINLIINSVICILLSYMFYILKSPLGSLIIFIVLISQTITVMCGFYKTCRLCSLFLSVYILWQFYIMSVVYALLMLN